MSIVERRRLVETVQKEKRVGKKTARRQKQGGKTRTAYRQTDTNTRIRNAHRGRPQRGVIMSEAKKEKRLGKEEQQT